MSIGFILVAINGLKIIWANNYDIMTMSLGIALIGSPLYLEYFLRYYKRVKKRGD